jgi:benzoyl-CoA reductase/2-hydroxyglutaryl-CoA dehydratase subunit BcrC/BadD/HgdB
MHSTNRIAKLESAQLMKHVMAAYFERLKASAEDPGRRVAWCSSVGPAELLYSMGFEVFFPENHAAMIGASKKASEYIPVTVSHGYSPDICSYLTSDIGAFLSGQTPLERYGYESLPKPDVLVYNTNQCREVKDWFAFYAEHFEVPSIGIHTPLNVETVSAELVTYIAQQYKDLIPQLEERAGSPFDIDAFRERVGLSHDACVLWRKVLETARNRPSPINFFDASIHMGPIVVMRGTTYALKYYRALYAELNERIADGIGAVENEQYRIYWEGMPLWFKLSGMAKLFAKLDSCVVASTYCNSWIFDDLDSANPFDSSALAYTKLFIARSDEVKEQVIKKHLEEFSVDGIIYHDAKTCPRNSNNRFGMPLRLQRETTVPYLELNGDLNDSRCYSEEQSIIAIETFIHQLAMRK